MNRFLSLKPFVGIGLISYGAYLWHQPIFVFARYGELPDSDIYMIGLSLITLLLAWGSWRLIERPFRDASAVSTKKIFQFSIFGILLFLVLGCYGIYNKGNFFRYPEHVTELNTMRKNWDEYVWDNKKKIRAKKIQCVALFMAFCVAANDSGFCGG